VEIGPSFNTPVLKDLVRLGASQPRPLEKQQGTAEPSERFTASSASSLLHTQARSLKKGSSTSRWSGVAKGALAVGTALVAASLGPVSALVAGTAAAVLAGGAVKDLFSAQGQRKQLNQVSRTQAGLWPATSQDQLSPSDNSTVLAVLQNTAAESKVSSERLKFSERYGPWAVVTGATSGIGKEFAKQLAQAGINPVLVARNGEKLEEVAKELEGYGVQVRTVAADLSDAKDIERVERETRDLNVGLLINNAGSWVEGEFLKNDVDKEALVHRLNMEAPMRLSSAFGKRLSERGAGGILNVGSALAHVPTAYQANYAGTKAYLNHFTKALAFEMKPSGVDVLVVNPGATKTEGAAHIDQSKMPIKPMSAEAVAASALRSLGKTDEVIPGWRNSLAFGVALRILPQAISTAIVGSQAAKFMGIER
jgi:short-subunit dehydrogenase